MTSVNITRSNEDYIYTHLSHTLTTSRFSAKMSKYTPNSQFHVLTRLKWTCFTFTVQFSATFLSLLYFLFIYLYFFIGDLVLMGGQN